MRTEAWPDPVNAEELHDALLWLGCLSAEEAQTVPEWTGWLTDLARDNRVTRLADASSDAVGRGRTVAAVPGTVANGCISHRPLGHPPIRRCVAGPKTKP